MAWTKQAFYFKYIRGKNPAPEMVFFIRVDYETEYGHPVNAEVVTSVPCKIASRAKIPDLKTLEHLNPGPTGLCSWHVIGAPAAKLADRPGIMEETEPHYVERLPGSKPPVRIPTGAAAFDNTDEDNMPVFEYNEWKDPEVEE